MKTTYLLYKITNLINGGIYIGAHSTTNINDRYFGSGYVIKEDINRYGQEWFVRNILFTFDDQNSMYEMEEKIVSPYFFKNFNTYNMIIGGQGTVVNEKRYHRMSFEDYLNKHGKEGYPEYDVIIRKDEEKNKKMFLDLLYQIMKNNGELLNLYNNSKNNKFYNQRVLIRKRIFVIYFLVLYYKSINFLNEKMLNNFEFIANRKIYGFISSHKIAKKYLSNNVPVSYVMDEIFCDWFLKKIFNILENVTLEDFAKLEPLRADSILFKFIEMIHLDHLKVLNNISSLRCKKSGRIKWLGENNYEELLKISKPKEPKPKKDKIKKASPGAWWK